METEEAGAATAGVGEAATGEAGGEETIAAEVVAMTIPVAAAEMTIPVAAVATIPAAAVAETTEAVETDRVMTMAGVGVDVRPEAAAGAAPRRSRRGMPSRKGGRCL